MRARGLSIRALLYLRSAAWAGLVLTLLALAGCAAPGSLPADAEAQLFTRGLDEIADLYIEPVGSRQLALSAIARVSRLDSELQVRDSVGTGSAGPLALSHGGRDIGLYAMPADTDSRGWGELLATLIAAGKHASPRLAALSQDTTDQVAFDGMTAALDRFSHYERVERCAAAINTSGAASPFIIAAPAATRGGVPPLPVIPAKAGIHSGVDPGLRRYDDGFGSAPAAVQATPWPQGCGCSERLALDAENQTAADRVGFDQGDRHRVAEREDAI